MKERIEWIDIAKGIVIFLMVIGHTSIPEPVSKWIWSFHMPFFFFISGLLFNEVKYGKVKVLLESRVWQLLIPYVLMSLIVFIPLYFLEKTTLEELITGWKGYPLWFVPVLFVAEITGTFTIKLCKGKSEGTFVGAVAMVIIGFLLCRSNWHYPYKIESVPLATFYFILGWQLKYKVNTLHSNWILLLFTGIVHLLLSQYLPKLDMCFNNFGTWFNPISSVLGIVLIMSIARYTEIVKMPKIVKFFFLWAGQNTLCIMGFASMLIMVMNEILNQMSIPGYVTSPAKHVLLWVTLYYLSKITNKFAPIIVGKNQENG